MDCYCCGKVLNSKGIRGLLSHNYSVATQCLASIARFSLDTSCQLRYAILGSKLYLILYPL